MNFLEQLYKFTAKLSRKYTEFPVPDTHSLPLSMSWRQSGAFVTTGEPTFTGLLSTKAYTLH